LAQDKIIKLNGDVMNCKITAINQSDIEYKLPVEDFTRFMVKDVVKNLIFESGNIEKINKLIKVNGESDWEKVLVTKEVCKVAYLTEGRELNVVKKGSGVNSSIQRKLKSDSLEELKRLAAANGYPIVLIKNFDSKVSFSTKTRERSVAITGVGYKY